MLRVVWLLLLLKKLPGMIIPGSMDPAKFFQPKLAVLTDTFRTFLRDLGRLLHLPAALSLLTLPVILFFREWFALLPFAVMSLLCLGAGQLLYQPFKKADESGSGLSIVFVVLAWLLLPLAGSIVFYGIALSVPTQQYPATAVFSDPVDCFFEAMSGFTGTGLTMVNDPGKLPFTLQWWRSLMEWIGGIGMIMFASLILNLNLGTENLYQAETRSWTIANSPVSDTIRQIWWLYAGYTFASVLAFYLAGMPFWQALNHGITAIGTGGFSVTAYSFAGYSTPIKLIAAIIMTLGAISFRIHYLLLFRRNLRMVFAQTQRRYFAFLLVIPVLLLAQLKPGTVLPDQIFLVASALGTCGLSTVKLNAWPPAPLFLLGLLMVVGGNAGSTAGGFKTERLAWLTKGIWRKIKKVWLPDSETGLIRFNGEVQKKEESDNNIMMAGLILFLWVITLAAGTLGLLLVAGNRFSLYQVLFEAASALSNVGQSAGVTSADLPAGARLLLATLMWAGRLEIMAVLILVLSPVYHFRKVAGKRLNRNSEN